MATRKRPFDPGKAALAAVERKARDAEAERLQAQGATVRRDRAGNIISAYRSNVFNLLLSRGTITQGHHDAAQDLAELWAVWKGLDGKADGQGEFVDNGRAEPDKRCLVTDRQLRAGRDVARVLRQLGAVNRLLLERLIGDSVERDRPRVWRVQVEEAIGVGVRDRQTRAVVGALEELRMVFQEPRERAA